MNKKFRVTLLIVVVLLAIPAVTLAHGDEDPLSLQADEFSSVAQKAAEHSNAPRSFTPCVQGYAGEFPCHKVDLLSYVPSADLGASFVNDLWGWTDPETGSDYALVGASEGTVFVDISDPKRPEVLGILPTASTVGGAFWRDIKVYADHAFVVSEFDDHPMQVFDLRELRGVTEYTVFADTAQYFGPAGFEIGHAHNININTDTGYAYIVGTDSFAGGLHIVDIADPANPTFAGGFADHGYTHDTQCVIYQGPDEDYQGRELCFSSNANFDGTPFLNTLSIADVTDKANPVGIANAEYPGGEDGYSHQGWLTPDQAYFLQGDELDELFFGVNTRTRIWDVTDLDNPTVIGVFDNDTTSIDHNIYIQGRYAFMSNYTSGLRVYDTKNVAAGELSEVAYFDVYPENDNASFEGGTWSNYPFFAQKGVVAVTSMDRGLFILQPRIGRTGN
ncbi:MAG: choice-of-anchor B family protein [Chloroflexota bacterium]|nr:MAG: choice-of-anchor B family protein [Chloroflexota bacterium]